MFAPVNLETELRRIKNAETDKAVLAGNVFEQSAERVADLDPERIFHLQEIAGLCQKYRLRFLGKKRFRGEIPAAAVDRMRELEHRAPGAIKGYFIAAPSRLFELDDPNKDPLLFASLGDQRFYLVHKWGNDLKWYRAITSYPFRNLESFMVSNLLLSLLITLLIPNSWMVKREALPILDGHFHYVKLMFFVTCFVWLSVIAIYVSFSTRRNFSILEWDCKEG